LLIGGLHPALPPPVDEEGKKPAHQEQADADPSDGKRQT
jgi:hypothetical protein